MRTLTECPVTCNALLADEKHLLLELCSMCLVLEHHTAASQAVRILTGIVSYCQAEKITVPAAYMSQIDLHLESLIYASLTSERHHKELANYLVSGVKLAEKNVEFGERFVQLVGGILTDDFGECYDVCHASVLLIMSFFRPQSTLKEILFSSRKLWVRYARNFLFASFPFCHHHPVVRRQHRPLTAYNW